MTNEEAQGLTHYRKAFNSPYLSAADIVGPTNLTISHVLLQPDASNKSKDFFNTAYFAEREIREGEVLKPMILNVGNSKMVAGFSGSKFIEHWQNIRVTIFVAENVKYGRDLVEGLRVSAEQPPKQLPFLTPDQEDTWNAAVASLANTGGLTKVLEHMQISPEHQAQLHTQVKMAAVSEAT